MPHGVQDALIMGFALKIILALIVGTIVSFLTHNHLIGLGGSLAVLAIPQRSLR